MIQLTKTDSSNSCFQSLVKLLDDELSVRDGDLHEFYHQYNHIDNLKYVLVGYKNQKPIVCGAIKPYNENTMEIKRMYTIEPERGFGFASILLSALENWAKELGFKKCILETGLGQPEAIRLYKKNGYTKIPNYGQYADIENSVCFEKPLDIN